MGFVISLVTSKGGAGKTTAAVGITSELERRGRRVSLIDGDPNAHLSRWHRLNIEAMGDHGRPLFSGLTDANILETVDEARGGGEFVVIDNEGVATRKTTFLFGRSSLVVVPMRYSELDLLETRRTIAAIEQTGDLLRKSIPYMVLLSQTPPLRTNMETHILAELEGDGLPVFRKRLAERVVWREVMNHGRNDLAAFGTKAARDAQADIEAIVDEIEMFGSNLKGGDGE